MQKSKSKIKSSVCVPAMQQVCCRCQRPVLKKSPGLDAQFPASLTDTHLQVGCNKCTVSYVKYTACEKRKYCKSGNDAFPCVSLMKLLFCSVSERGATTGLRAVTLHPSEKPLPFPVPFSHWC